MRIHILGICGTFMSGVALLAKAFGHEVSGSDCNVYPPMSTQLSEQGIALRDGFDPKNIDPTVDCVIIGNVIKRGNPALEWIMSQRMSYLSGPEWLAKHVLSQKRVLAVAGTHGKTTTSSLLAWILEYAGLKPGFLIGGVPQNFGVSAHVGAGECFVIEADEYDSAFFDKRPKFIHYRPDVLILNNLEFDHADIYSNLEALQQQFHFLIRTMPNNGFIVKNHNDNNLTTVLAQGCWSPGVTFGDKGDWHATPKQADASVFDVYYQSDYVGTATWQLLGRHNMFNALAAIAAAFRVGVEPKLALEALQSFTNVKRRLEIKGTVKNITVYDDFAHHPTAIATTLEGIRAKIGNARLVAILEFGSYTMRSGVHKDKMKEALASADFIVFKNPTSDWGLKLILNSFSQPTSVFEDADSIVKNITPRLYPGDHVVIMSNTAFGGIHQKLLQALEKG